MCIGDKKSSFLFIYFHFSNGLVFSKLGLKLLWDRLSQPTKHCAHIPGFRWVWGPSQWGCPFGITNDHQSVMPSQDMPSHEEMLVYILFAILLLELNINFIPQFGKIKKKLFKSINNSIMLITKFSNIGLCTHWNIYIYIT